MELLSVRLQAIRYEAEGIRSFELRPLGGSQLAPFTAGAHVDVHLRPGLVRSYSLCNAQDERHRYVIAVGLDRASRGGSRMMHEELRVGQTLAISPPRNNFPLAEQAGHSVLIAGGIGITPMLAMTRRLAALSRSWELWYCARSHAHAAFLDELRGLKAASPQGQLHLHFDDEAGGVLDVAGVIARVQAGTHSYCCGPLPMLEAYENATDGMPAEQLHVEYFTAKDAPARTGGFEVELARSGRVIHVAPGETILDAMLEAGVDVPYSCREGICATCETRVLAGEPDHRDLVLTPAEHALNNVMMVCCSGSKSARLVLDR
jgi:ferredoxin-NADP reductase